MFECLQLSNVWVSAQLQLLSGNLSLQISLGNKLLTYCGAWRGPPKPSLARLAIVPLAPIMALGASAGGDAKPSAGGNGDDEVAAFLVTGVRPTEGARLAGVC